MEAAIQEACKHDNPALMSEELARLAAQDPHSLRKHLNSALETAVYRSAVNVMTDLISRGADVGNVCSLLEVEPNRSSSQILEVLKVLVAHGWDINQPLPGGRRSTPIMWSFVYDKDLVAWCLKHGAAVHIGDLPAPGPRSDHLRSPTILEHTAGYGTVQTFQLLRGRGAPLGTRALQEAVDKATYPGQTEHVEGLTGQALAKTHTERLAMVRYLVEVVKLDVDTSDKLDGSGRHISGRLGPPIAYAFGTWSDTRDNTELVMYLVSRGADATLALDSAKALNLERTIQALEDWKSKPRSRDTRWSLSRLWRRH